MKRFVVQGWLGLRGKDPELSSGERWLGIAFVASGLLQSAGAVMLLIATQWR